MQIKIGPLSSYTVDAFFFILKLIKLLKPITYKDGKPQPKIKKESDLPDSNQRPKDIRQELSNYSPPLYQLS